MHIDKHMEDEPFDHLLLLRIDMFKRKGKPVLNLGICLEGSKSCTIGEIPAVSSWMISGPPPAGLKRNMGRKIQSS